LILWRKVVNSLLLRVVFKYLMVWISVCRNMTYESPFTSFCGIMNP
jgi:hypothetical protein